MASEIGIARDQGAEVAWRAVLAAAAIAEHIAGAQTVGAFALEADGTLKTVPAGDPQAIVAWQPGSGWRPLLPADDSRTSLLDLYLPICSATAARPVTVGHLGQSLDGFIATHAGDSQFVTGHENILHLHRMRALCGSVVVGAGTVAADDPQLTTRLVHGPSPLRVIFDPERRLARDYRVFTDGAAPTLYACARSLVERGETQFGCASIVALDDEGGPANVVELMRLLRARGCSRVFVEGGGVTVSAFLEANLLDRLQVAIAPLIIGNGRPAIRLPARATLSDCPRPQYRVFKMGGDVLFDCELTPGDDAAVDKSGGRAHPVSRII